MKYTYKTVQIPPNVEVDRKNKHQAGAIYLQEAINHEAKDGWIFQSVESIGVQETKGCLGSVSRDKEDFYQYHVIVFKREVD